MRSAKTRLVQALLVVALLCSSQLAHAQLRGLLLLQIKGYLTYTPSYIASQSATVTYDSSLSMCLNGGGVPVSDPTSTFRTTLAYYVKQAGLGDGTSFYTGSSAKPTDDNPNACTQLEPSTTATPNSANCAYRWRYGYYDLYSYNGEPGTAYWKGLYYTTGMAQSLNDYQQFYWADMASKAYPRGYYYTINGYRSNVVSRMDAPATPVNNDPNPIASFMVMCEVQYYPELPATTTMMPQPVFINGFKTLTWAQEHWWVIFLIVAVVLLLVLIAIIIYCCITSKKPKEEPPVHSMVLRERVGKAYILADTTQKSSNDSKSRNGNMSAQQQQMLAAQQREQEMMNQQMEAQRRLGRGFNPQEQRQDPEDLSMGAAGIFGRGGRNQYGDGNVVEHGTHQKGDGYYANVAGGGLHEDELAALEQPRAADNAASLGPSVTASKLKSSRRSRGRTISQACDDVDVPQAGEIDETNVNL